MVILKLSVLAEQASMTANQPLVPFLECLSLESVPSSPIFTRLGVVAVILKFFVIRGSSSALQSRIHATARRIGLFGGWCLWSMLVSILLRAY